MIRMCAHRLKDRGARDVIEPDGAKGSEFAIFCNRYDIQITAIDGHALNILIPLPALIFFIEFIR